MLMLMLMSTSLRAQTRHPDENYWISDEQAEEITTDGDDFPTTADWKEDAPEVSVDMARRHLWKQAKTEKGILRTVWEESHPSFDNSVKVNPVDLLINNTIP